MWKKRWGCPARAIDDLARIQVEITPSEIATLDHGGSDLRKLVLESKRLGRKLQMRRLPGFEILGDYLLENAPEPHPSVLSHSRYSMQNLLFLDKAPATISGVFGWERATACDPRHGFGGTSQPPIRPATSRKLRLDTAPVTPTRTIFVSKRTRERIPDRNPPGHRQPAVVSNLLFMAGSRAPRGDL